MKRPGLKKYFFLFLFVLTPVVLHARPYRGVVRRVLEPNLIQLQDGTKVRYLGIYSPQVGDSYRNEALAANRTWVENKSVELEYGFQERDSDGTWIAYVFMDGIFINEELVRQGMALVSRLPNEEKYLGKLVSAERQAQRKKVGQWKDSVLDSYPERVRKQSQGGK